MTKKITQDEVLAEIIFVINSFVVIKKDYIVGENLGYITIERNGKGEIYICKNGNKIYFGNDSTLKEAVEIYNKELE